MEYNSPLVGILLANLVLIETNFIGKCNFNYHTIATMTALQTEWYGNVLY